MSDRQRSVRARFENSFRGQLTTGGQLRNTFEAEIPSGTELEKLLTPSYWWSQNRVIRPLLDSIQCIWDDGTRIVTLRCMGKDDRHETILMVPVPGSDIEFKVPDAPSGYSYEFGGSRAVGWYIAQEGRASPLRSNFSSANEAHEWLVGEQERADGAATEGAPDKGKGKGGGKGGGKPSGSTKPAAAGDTSPPA